MSKNTGITLSPYKYLTFSERTNSIFILAFLIPQIIMLLITKSWFNILLIFSTTVATVSVELIEKKYKNKTDYDFIISIIQGIFIGLFLPSSFPFYTAFLTTFCVYLMSRYFIGDHADIWINLVALTICICWILGGTLFPSYQLSGEILISKNPALTLINNGTFPAISSDTKITSFFNKTVFSIFGVSIPDGYVSLFWDNHSSIAAFRFNILTLVSSIILFSLDVIKILIPGIFLAVYCLLVYFVSPLFYPYMPSQGDLLLALCTSGIIFCALFLLQFSGTTPLTTFGKIVYALIAGIIAFLIIGAGTSPVGAMFTILIMNMLSPLIEHIEYIFELKRTKSELIECIDELKEGTNA